MSRNFEFRITPIAEQRLGRFATDPEGDPIVIGAPVKAKSTGESNDLDQLVVELATGAQAPVPGLSGIAYYVPINDGGFAGYDPALTTESDLDTVPPGAALQVVHGDSVKVCFRNTNDRTFLNSRNYAGRVMVAGAGATPSVAVGDLLTPGTGSDVAGYWAETAQADNGWLRVTKVDPARGEVEAQLLF